MKNPEKIIAASLLGGICGALLGILFAPGNGADTRRQLISKFNKPGIGYEDYEADFYDDVNADELRKKSANSVKDDMLTQRTL
jgi:gas vesicle protein